MKLEISHLYGWFMLNFQIILFDIAKCDENETWKDIEEENWLILQHEMYDEG